MGTPDFAAASLKKIIEANIEQKHNVVGVYTQPPRKAGRGKSLKKSAVHILAEKNNIKVFTPKNFRDQKDIDVFASHKADVAIIVAYGLLLPKAILDAPKFGCLNLHGSLLPRWRGAAPIHRAIMAGDKKTGVMVMQMDEGLDTGAVALTKEIPLKPNITTGELHDEMKIIGADLLLQALDDLEHGKLKFIAQKGEGITYAKKISKSEAKINFSLSAKQVLNNIHGLSPFPGAWLEIELNDKLTRVKIISAQLLEKSGKGGKIIDNQFTIACASQSIRPIKLQRQGKGIVELDAFLRGAGELKGKQLS